MLNHDDLKLNNQLCFPLYVLSKEIINQYRPYLDELGITYPQYLVLMVLWEQDDLTVGQIGEKVYLDSGTLTPLLKRLEQKGIVTRNRCVNDERIVKISLTEEGMKMKDKACLIPKSMLNRLNIDEEELRVLKQIINKLNQK
jgi:MarR family transcriptional regulator, organic hydroperoxide resistance regulator